MPISLTCSNGHKLAVKDEYAGKKTCCPKCQEVLQIPARRAAWAARPQEPPGPAWMEKLDDPAAASMEADFPAIITRGASQPKGSRRSKTNWQLPLIIGGAAAAVLIGVVIVVAWPSDRKSSPDTARLASSVHASRAPATEPRGGPQASVVSYASTQEAGTPATETSSGRTPAPVAAESGDKTGANDAPEGVAASPPKADDEGKPLSEKTERAKPAAQRRSGLPSNRPVEASKAAPKKSPTPPARSTANEQAVRKALTERISVNFKDTPLAEAVDELRSKSGLIVVIDRLAIEEEGKTLVTSELSNVTLESALDAILRPLNLEWVLKQDVVVITSRLRAGDEIVWRLYQLVRPSDQAGSRAVIDEIMTKVAPDSWSSRGGPGKIARVPGGLVIFQSQRVHRELEKASDTIRPLARADKRGSTIRTALAQPVKLEFVDTPLRDVIGYLKDRCKINIELDEQALGQEGVLTTAPCTVHLENVSLQSALKVVLGQFNLTYIERKDKLTITNKHKLATGTIIEPRSYDVRFLISTRAAVSGNELVNLIHDTISPSSWSTVGGLGTVEVYASRGTLEVQTSPFIHDQIDDLLEDLRRIAPK